MEVVSLRVHPVKSTAITAVSSAYVGLPGIRGDREWMVVDEQSALVTARELPELFTIHATPTEAGVRLEAPGVGAIQVERPAAEHVAVTMFTRPPMLVRPAGDAVGSWLQRALGRAGLRLVWCDDPTRRTLNPEFSKPTDHAALQDNSPVSIASLASLRQLNEWIVEAGGEQIPIDRFRPNVVIDGDIPFAEDGWHSVRIGDVQFRAARGIDRCSMTLVDPTSLAKDKEPIRTLSRHRKWDGKTWFCHHLIPDTEGTIALGDPVVPAS